VLAGASVLLAGVPTSPTPRAHKTKPPVWITRPLPDSEELRKVCTRPQGTPIVEAHLLANGSVGEVTVTRSGGCQAGDRLVVDHVKRWTFKPARENGKPVSLWLTLTVSTHFR
jgi:TonB family protein